MSAIFVRAIFVFAYTLVCLAAGDVPNPFYPKSIASVALQSTVTDVIEVAKNRTHTLVVDSEFNIHVFESPQGGAVTHTLSMQLSTAARGDVGGTSWSHWRSDNAFALVMHPNLNTVMYAIKYTRLSKPRANIYILNTSVPFNQVEKDGFEYANTLSEFFTIPMRYPRLATNISFNYLYLGVFNDGSRDTSNNASGFWLSMHSIYNPFNSDFFRHIGSKTKRVLSMDFFCHELPVVCLWTSPDTVEEYSMEDLTFRREYTVASRPINFDPRIAMDATTYSSYFFHRDLSNADEFLLQRRNRTELLAVRTFPYQTSFAYDIPNYGVQLAPEGVTASVTTNSSVFPIGMGETDIVICQFDSSLNLKATTVLSTVKQDNMTKFFVQENGGFIVVGSTLGNLDSPASNSSSNNSVFVIQFEPLVVNSTISAKPMLFSAYESVEIRFSSVPASFASIIPTITFGQKNVTNVYWNNSSLYGQLPPGVGGPYDLWIHFDSPSHFNPKLRIGGYAYELPEIMSISPTTGPSVGFNLTVVASKLGVPNQDPVVVTIGSKLCLDTVQLDAITIRCTVPPGVGQNHLVVVSVGPISNSTQIIYISYNPPQVRSILPSFGPTSGGNSILIIGDGFGACNRTSGCNAITSGVSAAIGDKSCTTLLHYNDTLLNCTAPEGFDIGHTVSVVVQGQMSSSSVFYSYQKPNISIVIPASLVSTNPSVYIEGENFGTLAAARLVKFIDENTFQTYICPTVVWLSHTAIRCEFTTISLPLYTRFNITVYVGQLNNEDFSLARFQSGQPNSAPFVQPLVASMEEDTSLLLDISISDTAGDVIQLYVVSNPVHGRLYQWSTSAIRGSIIEANGTQILVTDSQYRILYVPFSNFFGVDEFLVLARDNYNATSLPQNIIITISAIEDPPVVSSENIYIDEDSTAILLFKASDGDGTESLNITILSLPQNGILLVQSSTQPDAENITITNVPFTLPSNISFAYFIPTSDENGMPYASVSYKANDGLMDSLNNGTITIYVKPVNDAPSFQRSSLNLTVYEDTPSVFRFNISDVDKEDSLSIRISELQLQGDLYVVSSIEDFQDIGQFKKTAPLGEGSEIRKQPFQLLYIPRPNFYTFDSFTIQRFVLTFTDGKMSVSEEVSFPVLPVNDPPRLHCDTPLIELPTQFTTTSGSSHEINLSVTDVDDINFTFNLIKAPQVGFLFQLTNSTVVRPITAGDSFQAWTLLYNSNFSGGGNPFGNFTLTVYDSRGLKSEPCTYIFSFTCPSGKFNNIYRSTGTICDSCPKGATCSHDGSQPIRPALGFWQSNKTGTFLPCVPRDACPGYAENTCATGYEGTRCGQCSRNYYRFNNTCQKCEEDSMSLSLAVIGGFFGAGLLLYALFKYIIGSGSRLGLISILINFIQTILLLQQMRLNWPAEFHKILNLLSFLNFNIELTSPECIVSDQYLNFSLKMRLALLVPFLILAVAVVVPILDYTFQYFEFYLSRNIFKTPVFRPLLMFRVFNSGLSVAFVHITSNSLALFDCSFEDDGYSYLDRDTSLRCYEEWWVQDLPIATLATCVYVIGVPVYFATICYFAGKFGKDPGASRFCKFCHDLLAYESSYQERFQFFTVVQLLQKLFIVLISTFFTRYTGLQIILTLALLFVSFLVLREYSPYSYKRLNHLEALSHVCAMVVLALGLPFHLDQFRSFVYQHILMLLIIFVICSFIVFTMAVGVYDVIKYFRERASPKPEMYTPTKKTYIKREPRK